MDRRMNTSHVQSSDEQQDETRFTSKGQKPVVLQAEPQEETLQPESLETEDTGVKQADPTDVQAQDVKENEVPVAENTNEQQVPVAEYTSEQQAQVANTDSQVNEEQQDPDIPEDQISRASQDDNYQIAIDDDEQDDTIQFSNPVTQPFLSRSVRVLTTEVGCLSFTQMLQDYSRAYPSPSHADAYSQIQQMAQQLDVYLSKYPAQYINCMTSDSEIVAFIDHTLQLALDLTIYPNIWAVLLILLETQDVNASYIQTMHAYYNQCYDTMIHKNIWYFLKKQQSSQKIICIIILLMEFQHMYSSQCATHQYS